MSIVYITEPGARLRIRDGRLITTKANTALCDEPIRQVEQIVLVGNVSATTPVIAYCLQNGIDIAFVSSAGEFRGRIQGGEHNDASIRQAQYRACQDDAFALQLARSIVGAKIGNQAALAYRYAGAGAGASQSRFVREAGRTGSIDVLRGIEGAAAAQHFRTLAMLLPSEFAFTGTRERPATDSINAALNFGYTVLYKHAARALYLAGLDPFVGCLHETRHGHAALASDLMEEWRSVITDTTVLMMVRRGEFSPNDFSQSERGVRFSRPALRRYIGRLEERLATVVNYPPLQRRYSYRQMIDLQARRLRTVFLGKLDQYTPYRWDW